MIANVSAHRRANAFAQALEDQEVQGAAAAQSSPSAAEAEQGRLLSLASGLGALPAPELDPEVKTVQRAQLIAAMEAQFAGGAAVPEQRSGRGAHRAGPLSRLRPRSRWSKGLAAGGLTVGVAAGAFGGVAAASSNALPGDTLYPVKRGMEDLKLGMADGDSARGRLFLDQASTRLQEARRLMERGRSGPLDHESVTEIRRTLSGMRHDAEEGHRLLHGVYERDGSLGAMRLLSSFTSSHREGWSRLREKLPVQLHDVGEQVTSVFAAIDDDVEPLRSLLHDKGGKHGSTNRPGASPQSSPGGHGGRSAPTPHAPSTADGKPSGKPSQSSTGGQGEREGLLGGTGLLQPPPSADGSGQDRSHGKDGKPSNKPDITIPPLLPDILPGLGIHGEDDR
ncbi:hypothetical protein BLA24_04155 [Streptomyces cinnamoneus]|uniref:DUF5667 domain-containing protein n=1 Tax=Streptomyces cinnamoneus TaxID=53446 RepID=A0A2G1XP48_STRCJ|nr:DUF5667 domain-containing protein [Streptomyces cinnamoneus]PHQ53018.1 hypothetical protein BLA24_04155 [Streptomyces cinnamoneus]PPT13874.1 hypothetical protein CYQ11_14105 [Streptomyces cinnamoneus]